MALKIAATLKMHRPVLAAVKSLRDRRNFYDRGVFARYHRRAGAISADRRCYTADSPCVLTQ